MIAPVSAASVLPEPRAFLDVTASVLGRPWRDRCAEPALQAYAATMTQAYGLPDLLARVLAGRGILPAGAEGPLPPRLRHLVPGPRLPPPPGAAGGRPPPGGGPGATRGGGR